MNNDEKIPVARDNDGKIPDPSNKLVFVSRLDADCSLGAFLLCELANRLAQKIPNLEINIIGGGSEYTKIREIAEKINRELDSSCFLSTASDEKPKKIAAKINYKLINVVGMIENVMSWLSKNGEGALFVGVSRAALEAMACGLPVILIGNEGYLGLLDEDKLESARKTNYTCRGFGDYGGERSESKLKEALFEEICRFFALRNEEKTRLCELSFREVRENYSAEKMTKMTIHVYKKAIREAERQRMGNAEIGSVRRREAEVWRGKSAENSAENERATAGSRSVKIAICGYYGRGNLGDEAILGAITSQIEKVSADRTSNDKKLVKIYVIKNKDPFKILKILNKTDLFIFGGGSLLQNSTSSASLFYYLGVIVLARVMSKRSIMLANGIGPLNESVLPRKTMTYLVSHAINTFDFISVRDTRSQKLLKEALPNRKIDLIFDPALSLFASGSRGGADLVKIRAKSCEEKRYFVFCPCARGFKSAGVSAAAVAKALIELANEHKMEIKLLVLNENEDGSVASELEKLTGASVCAPKGVSELCEVLVSAKFVMSQRYHGTLFAVACGTQTLSLSCDPKISAFCEDFGIFPSKSPEILGSGALLRAEISACLLYCAKNGGKIASNIKKAAMISQSSMQKCLKNFIFPIDKREHMFYNVENSTGKEDKWLRARKEMR